jgi:hypothetical protein
VFVRWSDDDQPHDPGGSLACPYCGEMVEVEIDESGGSRQSYVEDCPVCCRPWEVRVTQDQEGNWSVSLQTGDD